jgi:hypothetical protein
MARKRKSPTPKQAAVEAPAEEAIEPAETIELAETLQDRVIERPDGFYWESKKKRETYGPFVTLAEAEADMLSGGTSAADALEAEDLQEAESELGINEWIDPDTGGPAEDNVPRIEDH